MVRRNHKKVIILGAGPSGLSAAWNLVMDGHDVTIIEKEAVCGGQSITFERDGFKYDLGPHNIHSRRRSVVNFLKTSLGREIEKHEYSSKIFFRGKSINYPFESYDIFTALHPLTSLSCLLSFLWSRIRTFPKADFVDDGRYEKWIVNRFGKKFYDIFFAPYSEKVWGIKPDRLSDIVAKKRIAVRGVLELVHSAIFKTHKYHPENPKTINSYYPKQGIGRISDYFRKEIINHGGKILNNCKIVKLKLDGRKISKIHYIEEGQTKVMSLNSTNDSSFCELMSTIPINELILMLDGIPDDGLRRAARGLEFTSMVFLYMNISKSDVFDVPLLYFSEPEFPFNRIYDVGIFSREMVPAGKTALCIEISCRFNDDTWNMDADELFEISISSLESVGLLNRADVEDYHSKRLAHAYPCFTVGYEKKLTSIFDFVDTLDNFVTFGREGLFSYVNVDDAIWMGFEVSKNMLCKDRMKLYTKELFSDYVTI